MGCGELSAKFKLVLWSTASVANPASAVKTAGGLVNSDARKSLTSSRRKFTPNLKLCTPLLTDRSSTNCHCSTLRPCGKKKPKGNAPPAAPRHDMLVSEEHRISGNVALAWVTLVDWKIAE